MSGKAKGPITSSALNTKMDKKKHVFRSCRAGLHPGRIAANGRVGATILEYLIAKVLELELAGNASKDLKVKCITPRHLQLAI
uniref:Histone H2A n=1 Tax=Nelumbo nucifera TaxID=4432 RepID=A0A822Z9Z8_NELNU|nr:TPA_asm: hypothetical protein HUJ06_014552 [Nelumbo nucifera]